MAVRIRLKRMGKVRTPFYRIVVCDSRTKRDGRVIEEIGTYNPKADPSIIHVDSDRAQHWLGVGAQPSTPVAAILKLTGDWQQHKGEPVEPTLRTAEPRRDKTEIFNEALKEAHGQPKTEAVTKKAAKPDKKAEEPTAADRSEQAAKPDEVGRADKAHADAASGEGSSDTETAQTTQTGESGEAAAAEQAKSDEA
ncbi:MAG TPA: 30S ribosomal protein S16 [Nocardioidaceae bacterium]|nr:30S ribosomal protein S16 [Nocardioidaceae bacterium]